MDFDAKNVSIMFSSAPGLGYVPEDLAFSPAWIEAQVRRFYRSFQELRSLHSRVLALSGANLLDAEVYQGERELLGRFWRLYEAGGLKGALTTEQQTEVVAWFTWGNVELLKAGGRGLAGLALAPFVVVVIAGTSIAISYLVAREVSEYFTLKSAQEKAVEFRESVLSRMGKGELTRDQGMQLIRETPVSAGAGAGILDVIGKNLSVVLLVLGVGVLFLMVRK